MPRADTLKLFETLRREFEEKKSAVIAAAIESALESYHDGLKDWVASKDDIARFQAASKEDIARSQAATKEDITQFQAATKEGIAQFQAATKEDIAQLRVSVVETKAELVKWMFIFWAGQVATSFTLLKLIR